MSSASQVQSPYLLEEELRSDEMCERMSRVPLARMVREKENDRNVQTYKRLQAIEKQSAERLEQAQQEYRNAVYKTTLAERFLLLLCEG